MTCVNSSPIVLADLLDIVETALVTVSRHLPNHVGRDDLASAGKLALIVAMAQVEGSEDEIRAYCFVRVRGAMLDELRRLDTLSRGRRTQVKSIVQAQNRLAGELGRYPGLEEIAADTQLPVATVSSVLRAQAAEAEQTEIEWNSLPDTESPSPLDNVELADLQSSLLAALARLPANQALALRLYYLEDASLDDIAAQLGVSRERARQVREAGEKKLRVDYIVLSLWQSVLAQS